MPTAAARPAPVLHVLHTWGVGSHTFVRSTLRRTPGPAVVLCRELVRLAPPAVGQEPRVVSMGRLVRRAPSTVQGKAGVAVGTAVASARRTRLVHAHFAHELPLADRIARARRCPLVVSLYGHDLLVELRGGAPGLDVVRDAAAVVVLSQAFAAEVVASGVDPARVAVIPAGIEPSELPSRPSLRRPGPTRVLFVGRLVEKKGPVDAVRAVAGAVERGADVELTVLGSGPLRWPVKQAVADAGLGDRVTLGDGADRTAVLAAFADADIVLTPSKVAADGDAETLLVVNVEAQGAGVPVVTTRSGGIPDGVGPDSGVLVDEGDVDGLAEAVAKLAVDPPRREAMGAAGRAWVRAERTATRAGERTALLHHAVVAGDGVPPELRPT
ncbi:MAG TPA: glycosyltransferase [Iamia sp.]|nr:glycosyltransferase [Iamia sp.]